MLPSAKQKLAMFGSVEMMESVSAIDFFTVQETVVLFGNAQLC